MIEKDVYETLKEKYGNIASWAVWQWPKDSIKSGMRDVSMFEENEILETLNPSYVFVGLNGSGVHDDYMDMEMPWHNFHSSNPHGNDFKLRFALMDTPYWGAYITDAIKGLQEVDSGKVEEYLKKHPEEEKKNLELLKQELELLGTHPVIIAMGGKSYQLVQKYLGSQYNVKKILHYSYTIGKEEYRKHVLSVLSEGESNDSSVRTPSDMEYKHPSVMMVAPKEPEFVKNVVVEEERVLLYEQLRELGLDEDDSWVGDNRLQLLQLFKPLVKNSAYSIRINETDTTKRVLDLYYKDADRRCMGFEKMKDRMFKVFLRKEFYEDLKGKVKLPEPDPKKRQVHMRLSLEQLWHLLYSINT